MKYKRLRGFWEILGVWTLIALLFTGRSLIYLRASGQPFQWWQALLWNLVDWYTMGALTPLVIWLARRFPLVPTIGARALIVHLIGAPLYALLTTLLYVFMARFISVFATPPRYVPSRIYEAVKDLISLNMPWDLVIYFGMLGVVYAIDYMQRFRERELLASQLETQLAQAQFQLLKTQLQPHFLFNTLNAIAALVHRDPDGAERTIARLADLLRHSLEMTANQEVPLHQELMLLEKYLEIQKTRFRERLSIDLRIDPNTLEIPVPNLILQPIVENAIRHGISPRVNGGIIEIRAVRTNGLLEIEVRDNGDGFQTRDGNKLSEGVGLTNTRMRLQRLYGDSHDFILQNAPTGGATVRLQIPIRGGVTTSPKPRPEQIPHASKRLSECTEKRH